MVMSEQDAEDIAWLVRHANVDVLMSDVPRALRAIKLIFNLEGLDNIPRKNIALRRAYAIIDAQHGEKES